MICFFLSLSFLIDFWERKSKRERETSISRPQTWDQTRNLGMLFNQESNPPSSGVWDNAPTNQATPASVGWFVSYQGCQGPQLGRPQTGGDFS